MDPSISDTILKGHAAYETGDFDLAWKLLSNVPPAYSSTDGVIQFRIGIFDPLHRKLILN